MVRRGLSAVRGALRALVWLLIWALPLAGALAEGESAPVYALGSPLTGILEAHLPRYSFAPMEDRALGEAVSKLGAAADAFAFTGRVSLDGAYGYVLGVPKAGRGPAAGLKAGLAPDGSYLAYDEDSPGALIVVPKAYVREKGFGVEYFELYGYAVRGDFEYLAGAARRGVVVCEPPAPHLSVYMIEGGRHRYEYIRLTEEDLKKAAADKHAFGAKATGRAISLVSRDGEDGAKAIPASLYQMAVEKCGFAVASPGHIGQVVRAVMTVTEQGQTYTQVIEDAKKLKALASILKRAKRTSLSKCPFDGILKLMMADGRMVTVQKATDSCGTMVFGSAMCYSISDNANRQFWRIFEDIYPVMSKRVG